MRRARLVRATKRVRLAALHLPDRLVLVCSATTGSSSSSARRSSAYAISGKCNVTVRGDCAHADRGRFPAGRDERSRSARLVLAKGAVVASTERHPRRRRKACCRRPEAATLPMSPTPPRAAATGRGRRTNQTACMNYTTALFAGLVRAAHVARAGPPQPKRFTQESRRCSNRTRSRGPCWFVRRPRVGPAAPTAFRQSDAASRLPRSSHASAPSGDERCHIPGLCLSGPEEGA